jgi:hypothetical protein
MHPALQVHVLICQSVFFLDETVPNTGGNLYIKPIKIRVYCKFNCGNVKQFGDYYRMTTQAGLIMIKKSTAQNYIYSK